MCAIVCVCENISRALAIREPMKTPRGWSSTSRFFALRRFPLRRARFVAFAFDRVGGVRSFEARRGKRGAGVGASDADANDASWGVCSSRRRTDRSTDSRALIRPLKRKPNPIHRTEPRRGKDDARDDEQDDAGRDTDGDANEREDDACERANACGEAGAGEPVV